MSNSSNDNHNFAVPANRDGGANSAVSGHKRRWGSISNFSAPRQAIKEAEPEGFKQSKKLSGELNFKLFDGDYGSGGKDLEHGEQHLPQATKSDETAGDSLRKDGEPATTTTFQLDATPLAGADASVRASPSDDLCRPSSGFSLAGDQKVINLMHWREIKQLHSEVAELREQVQGFNKLIDKWRVDHQAIDAELNASNQAYREQAFQLSSHLAMWADGGRLKGMLGKCYSLYVFIRDSGLVPSKGWFLEGPARVNHDNYRPNYKNT